MRPNAAPWSRKPKNKGIEKGRSTRQDAKSRNCSGSLLCAKKKCTTNKWYQMININMALQTKALRRWWRSCRLLHRDSHRSCHGFWWWRFGFFALPNSSATIQKFDEVCRQTPFRMQLYLFLMYRLYRHICTVANLIFFLLFSSFCSPRSSTQWHEISLWKPTAALFRVNSVSYMTGNVGRKLLHQNGTFC